MTLRLAALLLVCSVVAGCRGDDGAAERNPAGTARRCGLPRPDAGVDAGIVPSTFLVEGAEVTKAERDRSGFAAAINIPLSVQQAFTHYRSRVLDAGYEIVSEDNEGFEAEIYVRKGKTLGAVQVRRSICDDASVLFVNILAK